MKRLWKEVARLHEVGAYHKKKRRKLDEFTETQILQHAGSELIELACAPDDMEEMGDLLGCLYHYAVVKGWDRKELEDRALEKLGRRFEG